MHPVHVVRPVVAVRPVAVVVRGHLETARRDAALDLRDWQGAGRSSDAVCTARQSAANPPESTWDLSPAGDFIG